MARAELGTAGAVARLRLEIPGAKLWSPEAPYLYGLRIRLRKDGELLDEVPMRWYTLFSRM